jgi:hypothetical protein
MRHERVRGAHRFRDRKTPTLSRFQRVVGSFQRHFGLNVGARNPMELRVHIAQDGETGLWYVARSDIPGLRVEGDTADELIRKIEDVAPDLVELNCDEILANFDVKPTAKQREERCKPVIRPIFDTPMAVPAG